MDQEVELFSGAPLRGHFPVIHQFQCPHHKIQNKDTEIIYKDLERTDWSQWTSTLSDELCNIDLDIDISANTLWDTIKNAITNVNDKVMPVKRISHHSKHVFI